VKQKDMGIHAARLDAADGIQLSAPPAQARRPTVEAERPAARARAPAAEIEAEALRALEAGDLRRALTILMDGFGDAIYRFCLNMVADEALARDVHQTTFVRAYEALPSYGGRSTLRTWLYAIAWHRALDALKSRRRQARYFDHGTPAPEHAAGEPPPDDQLAASRLARILEDCLERLLPKVRVAVLLRYREGLSYNEMAEISNEQPATLQVRVARSLPVLRRCIEESG
jgi:RNA polymerase sigma-70 factor (ECF subfamily)